MSDGGCSTLERNTLMLRIESRRLRRRTGCEGSEVMSDGGSSTHERTALMLRIESRRQRQRTVSWSTLAWCARAPHPACQMEVVALSSGFPASSGRSVPWFLHFEPSPDALGLRSDVIRSINILSPHSFDVVK